LLSEGNYRNYGNYCNYKPNLYKKLPFIINKKHKLLDKLLWFDLFRHRWRFMTKYTGYSVYLFTK